MATVYAACSHKSDSIAIINPGEPDATWTSYHALGQQVNAFQRQLAAVGVGRTTPVSIVLPNSHAFVVSFLAVCAQRAVAAPLNPAYSEDETEFYIGDLASILVLVLEGSVAHNDPAVQAARRAGAAIAECYWNGIEVILDVKEVAGLAGKESQRVLTAEPRDVALVLHTSGTTGRPKAVPLTHHNLTTTMKNVQDTYELTSRDRTYLVMPLFHVHGLLAGLLAPLCCAGSVIIPPAFSAKSFWSDFLKYGANWYTAVPTIHQILLNYPPPEPIPSIRFIRSCSSSLSPDIFSKLERTFNAPVLEAYAMTEAAHQMTSNPLPHRGLRRPGSVGIGQGVEVAILDGLGQEVPNVGEEGEISVRGPNITKGYLNNEKANKESFTADGFFRTGDQGKKDRDGYVYITGRIKELINRGGEKISPIELDHVITTMPYIAEALSFAVPSDLYGQEVGVAVVAKKGHEMSLTESDITNFVAGRTAKFKVPTKVRHHLSVVHFYRSRCTCFDLQACIEARSIFSQT